MILDWLREYKSYIEKYSRLLHLYDVDCNEAFAFTPEDYENSCVYGWLAERSGFFIGNLEEYIFHDAYLIQDVRDRLNILMGLIELHNGLFPKFDLDVSKYVNNPLLSEKEEAEAKRDIKSMVVSFNSTVGNVLSDICKICIEFKVPLTRNLEAAMLRFGALDSAVYKKEQESKYNTLFASCIMIDNKEQLLQKLHNLIDGKKGKFVAKVIKVCCDVGLIAKPTYTQVRNEFGNIGDKSGYNKYVSYTYNSEESNPIKKALACL